MCIFPANSQGPFKQYFLLFHCKFRTPAAKIWISIYFSNFEIHMMGFISGIGPKVHLFSYNPLHILGH